MALLEEVCHGGQAFKCPSLRPFHVHSVFHALGFLLQSPSNEPFFVRSLVVVFIVMDTDGVGDSMPGWDWVFRLCLVGSEG